MRPLPQLCHRGAHGAPSLYPVLGATHGGKSAPTCLEVLFLFHVQDALKSRALIRTSGLLTCAWAVSFMYVALIIVTVVTTL